MVEKGFWAAQRAAADLLLQVKVSKASKCHQPLVVCYARTWKNQQEKNYSSHNKSLGLLGELSPGQGMISPRLAILLPNGQATLVLSKHDMASM